MDRISFDNGRSVSSAYLNEVQKGDKHTGEAREDFYNSPTAGEESGWEIGQRDSIKDWELPNPRTEPETSVGRTAHDGIVLGWDANTNQVLVPGEPATRPFDSLGGVGVTVEAGTIIGRNGQPISWPRQTVQIIAAEADSTSYLYVSESEALTALAQSQAVPVSIGNSLPSVTEPHVPLAKITLDSTGEQLAANPLTGEVVGTGYVDLRPNTFAGNLNTYPQTLTNTPIRTDGTVSTNVWERVITDTSNGSVVLVLPQSPNDSDRIAIVDISGTFDRFPVIIRVNPVSQESINSSTDDWIINIRDAHLELFYHAETGQWKFEEAPGSECTPVLGTFLSCGGREFIGERLATECPDGQVITGRYPDPSPGRYSFEPSVADPAQGKCFRVYNDNVALYANGTGGLITVGAAPRCLRDSASFAQSASSNTIYVDCTSGDDSIDNTGFDRDRPFRTLERALIEAARESRRLGQNNDRYDKVVVELAPGDYYVDNSPGSLTELSPTEDTGLIQRVVTNYTVDTVTPGDKIVTITVDVNDSLLNQPPIAFNLGRVIYSESGGTGNISKIEKQSPSSSIWTITLEFVRGEFGVGDEIYYDNLSAVNPKTGGLIVPRGVSVDGADLRKVRLRPMYVPELTAVQNDPQTERTAILKVTGGTYVSLLTFTDNPQYARSHNTVTSVEFASQGEIFGGGGETSYYSRLNSLFQDIDNWGGNGLEPIKAETTIVAEAPSNKANRAQDIEENQTGLASGDSSVDAPIAYPGATRIYDSGGTILPLPDINSTRSSSPYIFNCSVRSIFGLNGLWANGGKVRGFKSMVTANFTQVSLQTDPNCFDPNTYFLDPPTNKQSTLGKKYKVCTTDKYKYRHFGMRGSNDAVIQIVSVFVIGNSDHFLSESGSDLSITNSCSDFGDISLRSVGFKDRAFSQDEAASSPGYGGTRITQIIPPLPLSYSALGQGVPATLEDVEINTGLTVDYAKTLNFIRENKISANAAPAIIRIYVQNSNTASQFSLSNPPSASDIAFGQFSYTKKISEGAWELAGGPAKENRRRIYVAGFDELGNSILYAGSIQIANPADAGFDALDDRSKIFKWSAEESTWYIDVITSDIAEEVTDVDRDGYLLKRFDYAFRYKLLEPPYTSGQAPFVGIDFIFDRSPVKIIRATDKRRADERVYRVVLEGFIKDGLGLRRPQPYYILEKQGDVNGYPLNGGSVLEDDPLTLTLIRTYDEVFRPGKLDVLHPGKYVTYLVQGTKARDAFTGDIFPDQDRDYPELTENPTNSPTYAALQAFAARPGVYLSDALGPHVTPIDLKVSLSAPETGIRIGLRRPSIIRASGHTWEWTGYLNYDTAFPTFQGDPLEQDLALGKIIVEENGGRVYATGMNEEGNYYLGTTIFDLRSGEQFSIPLTADGEAGNVTNQVLNNVIIKNSLLMGDDSNLFFSPNTSIFFSNDTQFKSLTQGDIVASSSNESLLPGVYARTTKAGLVQLASPAVIAGARNLSGDAAGPSKFLAVTAFDLANELNTRFESAVTGGNGVTVTPTIVTGGNSDPSDDTTTFSISIGLPFNGDTVTFAGLKLGSTAVDPNNPPVTSISNLVDKAAARRSALVTEVALRNYSVDSDQIADLSVTTGKIAASAVNSEKLADGSVTSNKLDNLSVIESKIANNAITFRAVSTDLFVTSVQGIRGPALAEDTKFVTEKAVSSIVGGFQGSVQPKSITANSQNSALSDGHTHLLESGSITSDKLSTTLGQEAVTTATIRNGAVTADKIASGTITTAKLSTSLGVEAVATTTIRNGAVTFDKLNSSAYWTSSQEIRNLANLTSSPSDGVLVTEKAVAKEVYGRLVRGWFIADLSREGEPGSNFGKWRAPYTNETVTENPAITDGFTFTTVGGQEAYQVRFKGNLRRTSENDQWILPPWGVVARQYLTNATTSTPEDIRVFVHSITYDPGDQGPVTITFLSRRVSPPSTGNIFDLAFVRPPGLEFILF